MHRSKRGKEEPQGELGGALPRWNRRCTAVVSVALAKKFSDLAAVFERGKEREGRGEFGL
jgi:hypothetical protein